MERRRQKGCLLPSRGRSSSMKNTETRSTPLSRSGKTTRWRNLWTSSLKLVLRLEVNRYLPPSSTFQKSSTILSILAEKTQTTSQLQRHTKTRISTGKIAFCISSIFESSQKKDFHRNQWIWTEKVTSSWRIWSGCSISKRTLSLGIVI